MPCRKSWQHAVSKPHKGNVGSQAGDCLMHHLLEPHSSGKAALPSSTMKWDKKGRQAPNEVSPCFSHCTSALYSLPETDPRYRKGLESIHVNAVLVKTVIHTCCSPTVLICALSFSARQAYL